MPQSQAAQQRLKHAPAPPRCYGQRLELAEGISPRAIPYHATDKAGNIYYVPLCIYRVFFSCFDTVAAPRATA
jgi:hypothetical protein